jgi:hypothetical protein
MAHVAKPGRLLPGDQVVTWQEIEELGLEEAPADIGLSTEEAEDILARRAAQ